MRRCVHNGLKRKPLVLSVHKGRSGAARRQRLEYTCKRTSAVTFFVVSGDLAVTDLPWRSCRCDLAVTDLPWRSCRGEVAVAKLPWRYLQSLQSCRMAFLQSAEYWDASEEDGNWVCTSRLWDEAQRGVCTEVGRALLPECADFLRRQAVWLPFFKVAIWNDHKKVLRMLLACLAKKGERTWTRTLSESLHFAASIDNGLAAAVLLQAKADVGYGEFGELVIHTAASRGADAVIHVLTHAKADVNQRDRLGKDALYFAATDGHASTVRELLGLKADLEESGRYLALHTAVNKGHDAVVQLLLHSKANVNAPDTDGNTPWSYLSFDHSFCAAVVTALLQAKADVQSPNLGAGDTALMRAIQNGHIASVRVLLRAGAAITAVNRRGQTPLACAAMVGHTAIASQLLSMKAATECTDSHRCTPLSHAVSHRRAGVVALLLQAKAHANHRRSMENTPLSDAIVIGCVTIVRNLVGAKAHVNGRADHLCRSPLDLAADYDRAGCMRCLLEAKADVHAVTGDCGGNATASASASASASTSDEATSDEATSDEATSDEASCTSSDEATSTSSDEATSDEATSTSSDEATSDEASSTGSSDKDQDGGGGGGGATVRAPDRRGPTPILRATLNGSQECVQMLADAKADVDWPDMRGMTPLSHAVRRLSLATVRVLISVHADVNRADDQGMTPICHFAQHCCADGDCVAMDMLHLLLGAKADVNRADVRGRTPISHAAQRACVGVLDLLLDAKADANLVDGGGNAPYDYNCAHNSIARMRPPTRRTRAVVGAGPPTS